MHGVIKDTRLYFLSNETNRTLLSTKALRAIVEIRIFDPKQTIVDKSSKGTSHILS